MPIAAHDVAAVALAEEVGNGELAELAQVGREEQRHQHRVHRRTRCVAVYCNTSTRRLRAFALLKDPGRTRRAPVPRQRGSDRSDDLPTDVAATRFRLSSMARPGPFSDTRGMQPVTCGDFVSEQRRGSSSRPRSTFTNCPPCAGYEDQALAARRAGRDERRDVLCSSAPRRPGRGQQLQRSGKRRILGRTLSGGEGVSRVRVDPRAPHGGNYIVAVQGDRGRDSRYRAAAAAHHTEATLAPAAPWQITEHFATAAWSTAHRRRLARRRSSIFLRLTQDLGDLSVRPKASSVFMLQ